jgi:hypothetical protein
MSDLMGTARHGNKGGSLECLGSTCGITYTCNTNIKNNQKKQKKRRIVYCLYQGWVATEIRAETDELIIVNQECFL